MICVGAAVRRAGARLLLSVLAFVLAFAAPAVQAGDPLYVIEQLVVSVSSAPGGEGDRVGTLKSGDRVELLDRQGDEAQIQLSNGTSGWVKASYLSTELPLQRRLLDRTAEVEKLKQDISRLQSQLAARPISATRPTLPAAGTNAGAAGPAASAGGTSVLTAGGTTAGRVPATTTAASPPPTPANGSVRDPASFMGPEDPTGQPPWVWVLSCSAVALGLGFVAGWRMLDRRIRRKYGGLRIY
jgi:hypothetical protein